MSDQDATYSHINKLERPLGAVRRLADALLLITETIDGPEGSAVNEIVSTMVGHIAEMDKVHSVLFRLHHPSREHFERVGWPTVSGRPSDLKSE